MAGIVWAAISVTIRIFYQSYNEIKHFLYLKGGTIMLNEDIINATNENVEATIENSVAEATKATSFVDSIDPRSFAVGLGTGVVATFAGRFLYRKFKNTITKRREKKAERLNAEAEASDQSSSEPEINNGNDNNGTVIDADYKEV